MGKFKKTTEAAKLSFSACSPVLLQIQIVKSHLILRNYNKNLQLGEDRGRNSLSWLSLD